MEQICSILSGFIMPALLIIFGLYFGVKLKFFYILHPIKFTKTLREASGVGGISPARALTQALAGTLGVGNMAGVATAIVAGGAGAVFWLWVAAFCAMSLKYAEVALGILCRRQDSDGFFGGAMYYIYDTFKHRFKKCAKFFGTVFAIFCITNSLLTGTIVQIHSAAGVFSHYIPPIILGGIVAALAFIVAMGKAHFVSKVTMGLIPVLSLVYISVSMWIILTNTAELPHVFSEIFKNAFSLQSIGGGIGGFIICRAIRFGVTRGIFSNEAGLGTSPCAHSSANVKSPHHQGCFGIFEVFADTIVICTMTALVILLSDGIALGYNSIPLTLYAYSSLSTNTVGIIIGISVILFAFATIICQGSYARISLKYLGTNKWAWYIYTAVSTLACIFGTIIPEGLMWSFADLVVSIMTVINICTLIYAKEKIFKLKNPPA